MGNHHTVGLESTAVSQLGETHMRKFLSHRHRHRLLFMMSIAGLFHMKGRRSGGPVIARVLGSTDRSIYVDRADEV